MVQWLRICLPMQGHGFDPWSGKTPRARITEPTLWSLLACNHYSARMPELLKLACPRTSVLQQDKASQWEPVHRY